MSNCKVIALTNQKGGVGKTTTAVNLGVSLVQQGKKVLLIDADAQANLTMALGYNRPDDIPITLSTVMQNIIDDTTLDVSQGIIHHREGVDLLPSNIELSGFEVRLINAMSRERVLKTYVNEVKKNYDYVLIDCMPSLGMITINALAAADSVIIPTQPHYLSAKGLELLLRSVSMVKRQINPKLRIDGILMTMVIPRTNISKEITATVKSAYGQKIKVFDTEIPHSIRAVEATAEGKVFCLRQKRQSCRSLRADRERRWQRLARSRETKIELTAYDDLFQTDESREEAKLSKIRDIPISEIDEFPDHPFKVLMDEDMEQLVESIKRNGVMTPATVRLKEDGRYELISGHRRKKACELAGLETLKCEVKELTRDEAIIVMVESNLQRSVILPSEKAFAYKMRLEAMKRQAGRPAKENYSPVGNNSEFATSSDELAEKVGESKNQIFRYIRLTELVPEILQMVDERQIAFRPAVEISYLTEEQQYTLLEAMEYNDATPSLAQAIKMKKYNQDGKLTSEVIQSIMEEEKPNQKEKPAFRDERITKLIPKTVPRGQETDFVVKALEFYNRHLQRNKAHER